MPADKQITARNNSKAGSKLADCFSAKSNTRLNIAWAHRLKKDFFMFKESVDLYQRCDTKKIGPIVLGTVFL